MSTNDKNEPPGKLPASHQKFNLSEGKSSNSLLDRMSNDAFNIVSSISNSEITIGAWVLDKETHQDLKGICNELSISRKDEKFNDLNYVCAALLTSFDRDDIEAQQYFGFDPEWYKFFSLPSQRRQHALFEKLRNFRCVPIKQLALEELESDIEYLNCQGMNPMPKANFGRFKSLKYLDCAMLEIQTLSLPHGPKITYLNCMLNKLVELDLKSNINLQYLNCSFNPITQLDLTNQQHLQDLNARYSELAGLKLPPHPKIDSIQVNLVRTNLRELHLRNYLHADVLADSQTKVYGHNLMFDDDDQVSLKKPFVTISASEKLYTDFLESLNDITVIPPNQLVEIHSSLQCTSGTRGLLIKELGIEPSLLDTVADLIHDAAREVYQLTNECIGIGNRLRILGKAKFELLFDPNTVDLHKFYTTEHKSKPSNYAELMKRVQQIQSRFQEIEDWFGNKIDVLRKAGSIIQSSANLTSAANLTIITEHHTTQADQDGIILFGWLWKDYIKNRDEYLRNNNNIINYEEPPKFLEAQITLISRFIRSMIFANKVSRSQVKALSAPIKMLGPPLQFVKVEDADFICDRVMQELGWYDNEDLGDEIFEEHYTSRLETCVELKRKKLNKTIDENPENLIEIVHQQRQEAHESICMALGATPVFTNYIKGYLEKLLSNSVIRHDHLFRVLSFQKILERIEKVGAIDPFDEGTNVKQFYSVGGYKLEYNEVINALKGCIRRGNLHYDENDTDQILDSLFENKVL